MFNTIGLMGAMPDEVAILKAKLDGCTVKKIAGVEFNIGTLNGKSVALCCAGMGKVNAAGAAQILVSIFGAECIIFSGIAGNMTEKISVGDIVISDTVCYHDAELNMICQSYPFLKEYKADKTLITAAERACEKHGIKHIVGKVATGDLFIGETALKQAIAQKCEPDCVEMEGAAVAHIAAKNDIPFVIVRAMSDDCSEEAAEKLIVKQFDITEYCQTASLITEEIVNEL